MNESDDNELVVQMASGSEDAFAELYNRYGVQLLRFLQTKFPSRLVDAEDIANEVWMRLFKGIREGRYEPKGNFRTFLFTIARNMALDHYRRLAARNLSTADVAEAFVRAEQIPQIESDELQEKLQALIENLPHVQRDIVRLRLAGVSYEEISDQLAMTKAAVHAHWTRTIRKLRQQFDLNESSPISSNNARRIEVFVDPGDAPASLVAELYGALDALYRACKGSGLKISKDERRMFVGEVVQ